MSQVRLVNGPCDPRWVEMSVTVDAETVSVRPMPFNCHDVYAVTDRLSENGTVTAATADYLFTDGARKDVDAYRRALVKLGTRRAFMLKRHGKARRVH